ncbi:hypothetical protein L249_3554 [Ophiocordyceps polyrhachis-furcata BCC 54312]|uniref:DUF202 domain-containing protein n=1 Tax=Ophiocordyceps polyrhachis-furcata BCC 54312 TaxID=1330021 RepID=A0A367LM98_9HYPO|nr:hypothetical protein L249_3554 [Ophiocordyceps polyrhachis-furcata BCC 54312]
MFENLVELTSPVQPHPEEHYHLRLHRARSVVLTSDECVSTVFSESFSFALVVLKIFTREFYPIGALFAAYGLAILLVASYRRYQGHRQFFTAESADGVVRRKFKTSGDTVVLMTALSLGAYATLLVLTWRLVA